MKTWLHLNNNTICLQSYDAVVAVLSRMTGRHVLIFAHPQLDKGTAYTWAELVTEIQTQFCPTAKLDWALEKL